MTTKEEQEDFKHYATGKVKDHVYNRSEQTTYETLAHLLPVLCVQATASLVMALPLDDANSVMEGKDKVFTASVLHICNASDSPGVWAQEHNARLANEARKKYQQEFAEQEFAEEAEKIFNREKAMP